MPKTAASSPSASAGTASARVSAIAITRAKNKCINFVSHDIETMPDGHFRNYVSFIKQYQERKAALINNEIDENIYKNKLEREVATEIRKLEHKVTAGVDIAGLSADLVVDDSFVIEIDGLEDSPKAHIRFPPAVRAGHSAFHNSSFHQYPDSI